MSNTFQLFLQLRNQVFVFWNRFVDLSGGWMVLLDQVVLGFERGQDWFFKFTKYLINLFHFLCQLFSRLFSWSYIWSCNWSLAWSWVFWYFKENVQNNFIAQVWYIIFWLFRNYFKQRFLFVLVIRLFNDWRRHIQFLKVGSFSDQVFFFQRDHLLDALKSFVFIFDALKTFFLVLFESCRVMFKKMETILLDHLKSENSSHFFEHKEQVNGD